MITETDDLWVKVIHAEMEFDYEIPAITWRSSALPCNSHNLTLTFKQKSYFLGARFWNYQIPPCIQPYTSEHKGPDEQRNKKSLDFHANRSASVSLLFLPRLQIPCSLWMATSASSFIADGRQPDRGHPCQGRAHASCLRCSRDSVAHNEAVTNFSNFYTQAPCI